MPPFIANWQQKIDSRVLRERVLIFLTLLTLVFLLWSLIIQNGLDKSADALEAQTKTLSDQRKTLEAQVASIAAITSVDPDVPQKNAIAQITAELAQLDAQLANLSQGLVSADQLPQILQDVLLKTRDLTLVQLQTLPAQELQLKVLDQKAPGEAPDAGAGVFKHAVSLRVSGEYFQVIKFLQSLEQLPWRFYWEQLDYQVSEYPRANIELRVYTLSAEEGLFGV